MISHGQHITNYKVMTDEDAAALGRLVEGAIHDGWQPFGALTVSPRGESYSAVFAQAVVKFADRF